MAMNKRWLVGCLLAGIAVGVPNLQAANADGPGMIVTYVGTENGISIAIQKISLPSGKLLGSPGSVGYAANPLNGGATEGIAPDGRQLPEWVDFEWSEPAYPERGSLEEYQALPHKTARVRVRERIPQAVVDEVMEAKRKRQYGKLPDKKIWVYSIWTASGVKFRWRLWDTSAHPRQPELSGGDEIGSR
ncbi:hypothetical protein GALL_222790 [mine drainage metagenome]|uniref:Uncharacterized protein n=1 Tax=mine drainage metagenome TaxID=410659 RepID=A0A1J5RHW8_9ZZZZ